MKLKRGEKGGMESTTLFFPRHIAIRVEIEGNWSLLLLFSEARVIAGTAVRLQPAVLYRRTCCALQEREFKGNKLNTCFF